MQLLVCICRILDVLNVTNSAIPETTYGRVSFKPHNHYDCLQNGLKIVGLEVEYKILLNTLTVKQMTTRQYLKSDSAMLYPLKRSGNH